MTTDGDGPARVDDDVCVDDARTVRDDDARADGGADARTRGDARMCAGVPKK